MLSPRRAVLPQELSHRYRFLRTLGHGSFSKVKLAIDSTTGDYVAIKILQPTTKVEHVRTEREIKALTLLYHPHIVQLRDVVSTGDRLYLIMDYVCGKELFHHVVSEGRLMEARARALFRQIVSAVAYCHNNRFAHRDLKLENLLVDTDENIKLVDFGFVNEWRESEMMRSACGTPAYATPEMLRGEPYDGMKVDMWALGVILFAMCTGSLPFGDEHMPSLFELILTGNYFEPDFLSDDLLELIRRLLCVDPESRATIEEVRNHPWVIGGFDNPPPILMPPAPPMIASETLRSHPDQVVIDTDILRYLETFGFDLETTMQSVLSDHPCLATRAYFLALQRRAEDALVGISDQAILMLATTPTLSPRVHRPKIIDSSSGANKATRAPYPNSSIHQHLAASLPSCFFAPQDALHRSKTSSSIISSHNHIPGHDADSLSSDNSLPNSHSLSSSLSSDSFSSYSSSQSYVRNGESDDLSHSSSDLLTTHADDAALLSQMGHLSQGVFIPSLTLANTTTTAPEKKIAKEHPRLPYVSTMDPLVLHPRPATGPSLAHSTDTDDSLLPLSANPLKSTSLPFQPLRRSHSLADASILKRRYSRTEEHKSMRSTDLESLRSVSLVEFDSRKSKRARMQRRKKYKLRLKRKRKNSKQPHLQARIIFTEKDVAEAIARCSSSINTDATLTDNAQPRSHLNSSYSTTSSQYGHSEADSNGGVPPLWEEEDRRTTDDTEPSVQTPSASSRTQTPPNQSGFRFAYRSARQLLSAHTASAVADDDSPVGPQRARTARESLFRGSSPASPAYATPSFSPRAPVPRGRSHSRFHQYRQNTTTTPIAIGNVRTVQPLKNPQTTLSSSPVMVPRRRGKTPDFRLQSGLFRQMSVPPRRDSLTPTSSPVLITATPPSRPTGPAATTATKTSSTPTPPSVEQLWS